MKSVFLRVRPQLKREISWQPNTRKRVKWCILREYHAMSEQTAAQCSSRQLQTHSLPHVFVSVPTAAAGSESETSHQLLTMTVLAVVVQLVGLGRGRPRLAVSCCSLTLTS